MGGGGGDIFPTDCQCWIWDGIGGPSLSLYIVHFRKENSYKKNLAEENSPLFHPQRKLEKSRSILWFELPFCTLAILRHAILKVPKCEILCLGF